MSGRPLRQSIIARLRRGVAIPRAGIRVCLDVTRVPEEIPGPHLGEGRFVTLGDTRVSFSRSGWETVDLQEGADFHCDFRRERLPFADASLDGIHSSHVIEHISLEDARALFREIRRCLKPGGVARFSTPDLDLLIDRYRAGDWRWFLEADGRYILENVIEGGMRPEALLIHNRLIGWLASYSGRLDGGGGPIVEKSVVDAKLAALNRCAFRDWCVSLLEAGRIYAHIHVWNFEELAAALKTAGFVGIRRASFGDSHCSAMTSPPIDREKHRLYSLYIEAERER